ncbi:MAG: hypothetical protein AzoDbin1_03876 [Azoarcus sp.]|nr:hypothetical protein [Azoarcus sp.]
MITININDRPILDALQELVERNRDLRPVLRAIGEDIAESTRRRFVTSTAPDGTPWAPNSQVTMDRYLGVFRGSYKKDGSLSKKGAARKGNKKPLIGESKDLSTTIAYQLEGTNAVAIGSNKPYAAMQQFGGAKAQWPHLWGDIPARPFLGLSDGDHRTILDTVTSYLADGV